MQRYELIRRQQLPRPLERIFPFFEKPEHLGLITPPSLGFRLLTPAPVEMKLGQVIDYRIHLFGLPVHWRSLISAYDPPHSFVDEQLIGPYGYWHHLHQFLQVGRATHLIDRVTYSLPEYLPKTLQAGFNRLYVAAALQQIFAFRQRTFAEIFG
jgi:ligand-binding SRPBCC domain-containing protein